MKAKITETLIDGLGSGEIVWDTTVRGFLARRRDAGGPPVFALQYKIRGRKRWFTIGPHGSPWTVEKARLEAQRLLGEVADRRDPGVHRDAERTFPTMRGLAARYLLEVSEPHKAASSQAKDKIYFELILKELGSLRVDAVTSADVSAFHAGFRKSVFVGNRCLALLSHAMKMAELWGLRSSPNPCRGLRRFPERKRERFLSEGELAAVGQALAKLEERSPWVVAAIRLLILTGARPGLIASLRCDEVDLERAQLVFPEGRPGAKRVRLVRLSEAAVELLRGVTRLDGNPYVFPGGKPGRPITSVHSVWKLVRHMAGIPDVRPHDLRHSFAAVAAGEGYALLAIGKLLGHTNSVTTERYAHLAADPLRKATEHVGGKIAAMLQPKPTEPTE